MHVFLSEISVAFQLNGRQIIFSDTRANPSKKFLGIVGGLE